MPHSSIFLILSFAPPFPPEIIAPACPILLPGGAVIPAIKPTNGFCYLFDAILTKPYKTNGFWHLLDAVFYKTL